MSHNAGLTSGLVGLSLGLSLHLELITVLEMYGKPEASF